jgi:hypothetical protein
MPLVVVTGGVELKSPPPGGAGPDAALDVVGLELLVVCGAVLKTPPLAGGAALALLVACGAVLKSPPLVAGAVLAPAVKPDGKKPAPPAVDGAVVVGACWGQVMAEAVVVAGWTVEEEVLDAPDAGAVAVVLLVPSVVDAGAAEGNKPPAGAEDVVFVLLEPLCCCCPGSDGQDREGVLLVFSPNTVPPPALGKNPPPVFGVLPDAGLFAPPPNRPPLDPGFAPPPNRPEAVLFCPLLNRPPVCFGSPAGVVEVPRPPGRPPPKRPPGFDAVGVLLPLCAEAFAKEPKSTSVFLVVLAPKSPLPGLAMPPLFPGVAVVPPVDCDNVC